MNTQKDRTVKIINTILKANGINYSLDELSKIDEKSKKKTLKKLRKQLKELEYLKRTGGLAVVLAQETVITTYLNNSMNRKTRKNRNKVVF